jgi:hypothetical protein
MQDVILLPCKALLHNITDINTLLILLRMVLKFLPGSTHWRSCWTKQNFKKQNSINLLLLNNTLLTIVNGLFTDFMFCNLVRNSLICAAVAWSCMLLNDCSCSRPAMARWITPSTVVTSAKYQILINIQKPSHSITCSEPTSSYMFNTSISIHKKLHSKYECTKPNQTNKHQESK